MNRLHEAYSEGFLEWERRGRGWEVFSTPVHPEPPFRRFCRHRVTATPAIDDGRRPTFLSSLVARISNKALEQKQPQRLIEEEEEEPPEPLDRGSVVELFASLPANTQISKEVFEQFLSGLAHCREPIAFELIGTHDSITAQFVTAEADVDLVRHQLEAHFPEAVFTKQDSFLEEAWNRVDTGEAVIFEFGLAREFMLQIAAPRNFNIDPFIGLAAAMSILGENELAVFQVIFEPVRHRWDESILRSVTDQTGKDFFINRPELAGEARQKIARPLHAAVVRIAVKSHGRMLDIAKGLAGALTVYSNPTGNKFLPLENSEYPFAEHEEDLLRRQSRRSGMILNSEELVSLVHLPSASVRAPKLRREASKAKAPPQLALSDSGILLGTNTYGGVTEEIRLNAQQRVQHTHIIGASGTGKSTLFFNLIKQDMENGEGLAVFDPHGDLIDKILGSIPEHRIDDVVLIDPSDETYSVGFNILSAHSEIEKNLLASDLVSVFQRLSTSWGDQMGSVLNNAILAFLESSRGGTLADLQRFLIEPAFRNEFLASVQDSQVQYYWTKAFPMLTGNRSIGPVLTRLGGFLDKKPVRYMVTQKENRIDFAEIMNTGKIFLAKLAQGLIGNENAYLLGSFMVCKFQQLAMSRQAQAVATRRDFFCYCDEFHNFITPSMAQILSGARKYRLGLALAHQELRQLERDREVASAVSACFTRVVFRVGDDDAKKLSEGFAFFEARDLQNLETGQAICRVERSDYDFNLSIPYAGEPDEVQSAKRREEVITASRKKYARARTEIEDQFRRPPGVSELPNSKHIERTSATDRGFQSKTHAGSAFSLPPLPPSVVPISDVARPPQSVCEITSGTVLWELGRGGLQHKSVQKRIKAEAERLGLRATIESPILNGEGSVDLWLEHAGQTIACEISVTTSVEHEVGNVLKCLRGGAQHVAVVCIDPERLSKIDRAMANCLGATEKAKVAFYVPDQFVEYLSLLAKHAPPIPKTIIKGGRKVTAQFVKIGDEERKRREALMIETLTKAMHEK